MLGCQTSDTDFQESETKRINSKHELKCTSLGLNLFLSTFCKLNVFFKEMNLLHLLCYFTKELLLTTLRNITFREKNHWYDIGSSIVLGTEISIE